MGLTAQAFTPAVWIRALQTLSGRGKKQVEHLAFGDAGAPQPQGAGPLPAQLGCAGMSVYPQT